MNHQHPHILRRDGASRSQRLLEALASGFFKVDERTPHDLLQYANALAGRLNYYNPDNQIDGNWQDFFPEPDEQLLELFEESPDTDGRTPSHLALFVSFLRLFELAKADLNQFTQRHLEFYYRQILGLERRPRQADRVFIVFELAKNLEERKIESGTLLDAGKDHAGRPRRYATEKEIVINKAKIKSLKSIYVDSADQRRVFVAGQVDSADGQGASFEGDPLWRPFGESQKNKPDDKKTMLPGDFGLAVADPLLHLTQGERTLRIVLQCLPIDQDLPTNRIFRNFFQISFSGPDGWTDPISVDAQLVTDLASAQTSGTQTEIFTTQTDIRYDLSNIITIETTQTIDRSTGLVTTERRTLTFNLSGVLLGESLSSSAAPITEAQKFPPPDGTTYTKKLFSLVEIPESHDPVIPYQEDIHQEGFASGHPVMKLILNRDVSDFPYRFLSHLQLDKVGLDAWVRNIADLHVQNNQTTLDAGGPFTPFGAVPAVGSAFYVGHPEIFKKEITDIFVDFDWFDVPEILNDHYSLYGVSALTNQSFKASVAALAARTWHDLTPSTGPVALFEAPDATQTRRIQLTTNLGFPKEPELAEVGKFDSASRSGFLRFRFEGVIEGGEPVSGLAAFGHKEFPQLYAAAAIFNATHPDSTVPFPNEPYTPTIESIRLGYNAGTEISLQQGGGNGKLFHVEPFGQFELTASTPQYLFPEFHSEGYFFIGFEDLTPPRNLSVLFQVAEGTQSLQEISQAPVIQWSYLAFDQWVEITKLGILSDSTENFQTTGIIEFSIGRLATKTHTRMPGSMHWLRGQLAQDTGGVNQLVRLTPQAVTAAAVLPLEEEAATEEEITLPPDTISKLVVKDAAVKSVTQPLASFGGRPVEEDDSYFQRISERLRHKNRAIAIYDYEKMVLEAFPSIYKVKCLQNTTSTYAPFTIAPGYVTLVVISNLRNKYAANPLEPKTSSIVLRQIKSFIQEQVSGHVQVEVENPIYERLLVEADIGFLPGFDPGFYGNQLNEDIKRFLSPWAFEEGEDIIFGGKVFRSDILAFIEKRFYVDFVNNFKLYHILDSSRTESAGELFEDEYTPLASGGGIDNTVVGSTLIIGRPSEVVVASTPASILISAPSHRIKVLNTGEFECQGGFEQSGIGFMFVGINFEVSEEL
jgi:hypothetical protein